MKKSILFLSAIIGLAACSKKKDNPQPQPTPQRPIDSVAYPSYSMLKPGNYWVYEYYQVNGDGTETKQNWRDSVYVAKDTTMNNRTWHEVRTHQGSTSSYDRQWLRDSLHYIVDYHGGIQFSSVDYKTVFKSKYMVSNIISPDHDSVGLMQMKMGDRNKVVTVPAGTFTTSSIHTIWQFHPYFASQGLTTRTIPKRYAANVGMVSEEIYYLLAPYHLEKRLSAYSVK